MQRKYNFSSSTKFKNSEEKNLNIVKDETFVHLQIFILIFLKIF